ncbi:MAG TPA: amidohydrolase family protein [Actinomycetota bacterium]|nr:amidohydrolase family protein [Actinomycetota bacterium]
MAIVITGDITTFDPSRPHIDDGAVYVSDEGTIEAVREADQQPPSGYENAPRVVSEGVVYPGLTDLHNHLLYNFRSLWVPPRTEPYETRNQWPDAPTYATDIKAPANVIGSAAGKAMLKYAEVKAIVGGATATQGSAKLSRPYEGWLIRNIEFEKFGGNEQLVYQSVITLGGEELDDRSEKMAQGRPFIYHLCEGTSPNLLREFHDVRDHGCLQPRLVAIHSTALGRGEFDEWAPQGGSIVWSPLSNLWLYRATTNVVDAAEANIRICLGADWGPSGSKNILGELKVADIWNRNHLDGSFTDRQLCLMVTANPAAALGWEDRLGTLRPGHLADLIVVQRRNDDAYRNLIEATERDVWFVMVGGRPLYGRPHLMRAAGATSAEPIYVAGIRRAISLVDSTIPDADMTWAEVVTALNAVRSDPVGLVETSLSFAEGEEPLRIIPDMPGDEMGAMDAAISLTETVIPPIDTIHHDVAFFELLERGAIVDGLLDDMRAYYLG